MQIRVILMIISLLMAAFVMIIHELTKTLVYYIYLNKNRVLTEKKKTQKNMFKIWRYVDPIGLIFAITNCGIFSKQFPFLIKSKKAAIIVGISGLLSMLVLVFTSSLAFRLIFGETTMIGICLEYVVYHSITLLIFNLFPVVSFDISLIFAGCAPGIFLKIRKYDAIIKLLLMVLLILGIFSEFGLFATTKLLLQ